MRKGLLLLALLCLAGASAPVPSRHRLCEGFLPENDLKIPEGDVHAQGITETDFNAVLDRVRAIYAPIVAAKGGTLVVNRDWSDPTVNAYAYQSGTDFNIQMFGGLARHATITKAGFALVACHEIGHHIGGFPKKMSWATNEGGADYFATLKCLRLYFKDEPSGLAVDPAAAAACDATHPAGEARLLCQSGAMSGHSVARLFQALRQLPTAPAFTTPDPGVVEQTNDAHPAAQCRLDTYFQGALCVKPVSEELSNAGPVPGACTATQGFSLGLRPRCWYMPPPDAGLGEGALSKAQAWAGALSGHGL